MPIAELKPEQLMRRCDPASFDFETTAGLPNVSAIIGQPRGTRSIEFGIDIDSPGFNIFVLGETGTGRSTALEQFLKKRAALEEVPPDWAYVNNFREPHKPCALRAPPGTGRKFCLDMQRLVEQLRQVIPQALERDEYKTASGEILQNLDAGREALLASVRATASAQGFGLLRAPEGLTIVPLVEGQPIPFENFESLPDDQRQAMTKTHHDLEQVLEATLDHIRGLEREAQAKLAALQQTVAAGVLNPLVKGLKTRYVGLENVVVFLEAVRLDILQNLELFGQAEEGSLPPTGSSPPPLRRYAVNVVVDHTDTHGAPVVVEHYPTFYRLVGRVEHENRAGGPAVTDFTLIRSGALLQANGGYLVLRARDVWQEDLVWDALKRTLLEGQVRPEDLSARGPVVVSNTLEPEPIPLDVKVVLVGPPGLYAHLYYQDDDFGELFKVRADFDDRMDRTAENEREYALFVASRCFQEGLCHFDRSAVARMVELGSRLAGSQRKLSTRFGVVADLVREASYWAENAGRYLVSASDVDRAWWERVYRSNLAEERDREHIEDGSVSIDTSGSAVGQVNALTYSRMADHAYAHPSRVAAQTYAGTGGVVQIDREVNLAGPLHNKGVLTLMGYLGGQFAREKPLAFTAQVTFEQNYGELDGDSASCAELYAILSSLAQSPLKQSLAVTGTLNQRGQVQPIGAATEKVEGFFDLCFRRGLTGVQGVIIPANNLDDLNLRADVVQAAAEGQFHVWTVTTVDEGMEMLTGEAAEEIHKKVHQRLKVLDREGLAALPPPVVRGLRHWLGRLSKEKSPENRT